MQRPLYLLDDAFSYEDYICDDVGPAIAADYGWDCGTLGLVDVAGRTVILDPWIKGKKLVDCIQNASGRAKDIWVRVVDANWPLPGDQNSDALRYVAQNTNVNWMFNYTLNEFSGLLLSIASSKKFVIAPYLYDESKELSIDHDHRINKIIISGGISEFYEVRNKFKLYRELWPPLRLRSDLLKHPGYTIREGQHDITRDRYLEHLSKYCFAFVCSGRTKSEFLKYREFAYAGVAPVGDLPESLFDCPSDAFVRYIGGVRSVCDMVDQNHKAQREHSVAIARNYRKYMKTCRDRHLVSTQVNDVLASA